MNRPALILLILAILLLPVAFATGNFNGASALGVLIVVASVVLTIVGAPSKGNPS